jgi:hypothetical protein
VGLRFGYGETVMATTVLVGARIYLQKLAQLSGAKLAIVPVGANREDTIFL